MIGTEVLVEGYRLDVLSGLDFSFNYAVADIRTPDKRQTEFTKTVRCAGTANNHVLFGNLFEADISNPFDPNLPNAGINFNPNKKASVQVLQNSLPQLDGSMQLRKITLTQGKIEYEVVFIGRLIDIFGVWGDQQMNGRDDNGDPIIDLTDLDHDLTESEQSATWYAPVGVGYVYPIIDYGRNTTLVTTLGVRTFMVTDLRPAMYVKELWDRIFAYADATYDGSFFTAGVFARLIIPWTAGFQLTDLDIADRTVYAERTVDKVLLPTATEVFDLDSAPLNPFSQYNVTTDEFTIQFGSTYVVEGQFNATVIRQMAGAIDGVVPMFIDIYVNGLNTYVGGYANVDLPSASLPVGTAVVTNTPFTSAELVFNAGDVVQIVYSATAFDVGILSSDFSATLDTGSFAQIRPVNEEPNYGDPIRMNFGMPETTIKDWFLSILKMFNLYMIPSKTIDRHYTFQTRNDYYASGQLLDWTYKLARDKPINITPMGLLSARQYVYTYSRDGDYYNERFQSNYGEAYGNEIRDIDNDFVPERKETEVVFSPSPLVNDGISSRIVPKIYDADISEGAKQTDANIRIMYYGGMIPSFPVWGHGLVGSAIYYDNYPYAGHWDNPITPTLDINFGMLPELFYQGNGATGTIYVTNNTLFKAYHEAQFLELASKDSKLITAMFDLTELDIQQLDFRNTILIDQTYYRLNKVMDYNPFKTGLTKVELFKAGDVSVGEASGKAIGSGGRLGTGKYSDPMPKIPVKSLLNGNQFEPFQGNVIGRNNKVSPNAIGFFVQGDNNQVGASQNVTLIGSNNVVANGVVNVTAIGVNNLTITQSDTTINGSGGLQYFTADFVSADVLTAVTASPEPMGLTLGSGSVIAIQSIYCGMTANLTTPYDTNTVIAVRYVGASEPMFTLDVLAMTVVTLVPMIPNTSPSSGSTVFVNGALLEWYVVGGAALNGTGTLQFFITYITP